MAQPSKSRSNRRSSSSTSYASTLTTLVFISLCVLGLWMLTSNSVVSPKTRTAIDNDFSSSTEDTPETTTTTTTNIDDSTEATTTTNTEESTESTTTTTNIDDSNDQTTTNNIEDSPETTTKSQDQKDTTVFGDNPGNLPDDAIKTDIGNKQESGSQVSEENTLTQKQEVSITNEATVSDNDQKINEFEKDEQSTHVSEESNTAQDDNPNAKQNEESQNANAGENQEEVQSFDNRGSRNRDDEPNEQPLREDKISEVTEKDQKQRIEDEGQEMEKPKVEKTRRKSSKGLKKELKKSWSTQADESRGEKERQKDESGGAEEVQLHELKWSLCNVTAGADFIPCLDNEKYLKTSHRKHYEHRERHCPEDAPTCLVPLPQGYKTPIQWPSSRDKIWYHNIPHTLLADVKGHQNWVKLSGEFLTFPGGGTQFIHGALHYIDFLQKAVPEIAWGKHTRVILDVGCGVGSLGGYLFERDVIAMSFAPKDEHEAQVQFALERGIPAISAVMGTQRLQFPSSVFDLVHCARCRVPWHEDGGMLLLELNRVLRPGGYFVWCATPVYQTIEEDADIWKEMTSLTKSMCWELVTIQKDELNQVGAAFYRKPISNECYEEREQNQPPMCKDDDDPNAAWYVPLQVCMHKLPVDKAERGTRWPEPWPRRLQKAPYWLNNLQVEKQVSQDFAADNERWNNVVDELSNSGVTWSNVRNVMDMRATYGGFAAALKDLPVWVFNVVNSDSPDTLPIIYERGLIGIYHDWCESFSTYPRTYDLLHADHLFSNLKNRYQWKCNFVPVIAEVDRILRPGGNIIVRDESSAIGEVENLLKSLHWEITSKNQEGVLCAKKGTWRPNSSVNLF
ncbi:probable methyltransferase PMT27 [Abrus precatorius]|uniref:Probable methyltransferase PMT27 n=1 Tax=Abrus precatorius TaxID=3816 RepID=A0A8B8KVR3_ABRPR|nr:probable methyltransferase PMT27 [Abrus precatorius]